MLQAVLLEEKKLSHLIWSWSGKIAVILDWMAEILNVAWPLLA